MSWDEIQKIWFNIADSIREGVANPISQVSIGSYNVGNDRRRARQAQAAWQRAYKQSNLADEYKRNAFADLVAQTAFEQNQIAVDNPLWEPLSNAVFYLLATEDAFYQPELVDLSQAGPAELIWVATEAERRTTILSSRGAFDVLQEVLLSFIEIQLRALPDPVRATLASNDITLRVPTRLIDLAEAPHQLVQSLIALFVSNTRIQKYDLFDNLRQYLLSQAAFASGYTLESVPEGVNFTWPRDRMKEPIDTILETYIEDTPLMEAVTAPIEMTLPTNARLEHCHILGGTGHGKTQCLQYLLYQDLKIASHTRTSIIVIDSQGDLINKITSNELFDPTDDTSLAGRLILIDPADIERPPALNLFDPGLERLENYSPRQRELVFNSLVDIYGRFFGKLLATELTGRQETVFRYLARLMLTIERATIHTLIALMDDTEPFTEQIATLDPTARRFFEQEFASSTFRATRQQIKQRLYSVLSIPTFDRLFSAPRSKINFFDALNDGSVLLVNTSKDLLKKDGTAILGRFMLSLIEHAIMERSIIPEDERTPTWLYVDEAQDYFDETIETMLVQARKYKCGLILAHQNLSQLDRRLKAVFMGNTSVKIVGGVTEEDARALDGDMRSSAEFLLAMKKRQRVTEFALSVRNLTPQALKVDIPLGYFESQPTISPEQKDVLLELNRQRVGYAIDEEEKPDTTDVVVEPVVEPEQETNDNHRAIQNRLKQVAQAQSFAATIEQPVLDGQGRIDLALERGDLKIAIEVSVTTKPDYELHNVRKCLAAGYQEVWVTSPNADKLTILQEHIAASLLPAEVAQVSFLSEGDIMERLTMLAQPQATERSTVMGYTVATVMVPIDPEQATHRKERLIRVLSNLKGG